MGFWYLLRQLIQAGCHAIFSGSFQRLYVEGIFLLDLKLFWIERILCAMDESDPLSHGANTISVANPWAKELRC